MKHWHQLLLLLPHVVSVACFKAALAWMRHVGTNRSDPDFYLAMVGFVALAAALLATIAGFIIVFRHDVRRYWPWLVVHLAALGFALVSAGDWFGAHLA